MARILQILRWNGAMTPLLQEDMMSQSGGHLEPFKIELKITIHKGGSNEDK